MKVFSKSLLVKTGSLLAVAAAIMMMPCLATAQEEEEQSRWGDESDIKKSALVLTRRSNNNAYGTSAFSFLKATQEVDEHRNYVDLVYNGCGLLHFNPVTAGMESRVCDLGEQEDLDVEFDPDEDRIWAVDAFMPEVGHVYLQQIRSNGQTMTVKYRINEKLDNELRIDWSVVEEKAGPERAGGMAGTMGQCGGAHRSR